MSSDALRTRLLELMNVDAYLSDEEKGQFASNLRLIVRQQHKTQQEADIDLTALHLVLGSDEQGGGFYMIFFDDGYKIKGKKVNVRHKAMHGLRAEVEKHIGTFCSAP